MVSTAANSGDDQLAVVDMAIAQLPEPGWRDHHPGEHASEVEPPVLVRADSAGAVRAFIDGLVARNCEYSASARVSDTLYRATMTLRHDDWQPAHGSAAGRTRNDRRGRVSQPRAVGIRRGGHRASRSRVDALTANKRLRADAWLAGLY
jgi:hypothetical protein